jgi:GR25 family glycosyltransferase involved in LPS biosynthesis
MSFFYIKNIINIINNIMKHYWINTDKCIDRREYMEKQFKDYNIENYRISAETPETIKDFTIMRHNDSDFIKPIEFACLLSHLKAIKKGYDDGNKYFCVCEDDFVLCNIDENKLLNHINNFQDKNNAVIEAIQLFVSSNHLIYDLYKDNFVNNDVIIKRNVSYPGAVYYLVSREGASKILNKYILSNNNYDLSFESWAVSDNLIYNAVDTYVLTYPIVITNIKYGSTIHPEHLVAHEEGNNVIRSIWNANNKLDMFIRS